MCYVYSWMHKEGLHYRLGEVCSHVAAILCKAEACIRLGNASFPAHGCGAKTLHANTVTVHTGKFYKPTCIVGT